MDKLKSIVAQNILSLRTAHHLTQFELGEKLHYSDKAVSRWERGEALPDAYVLSCMSDIFQVPVDYLLHDHSNEAVAVPTPRPHINYKSVTLISVLGVWTLALLTFVVLFLLGQTHYLPFVYACPASLIVLLVLNSVWGKKRNNLFILSGLCWSSLASLYLSFFYFWNQNWWILFLLGIPAQIIILLCFHIRPKKNH